MKKIEIKNKKKAVVISVSIGVVLALLVGGIVVSNNTHETAAVDKTEEVRGIKKNTKKENTKKIEASASPSTKPTASVKATDVDKKENKEDKSNSNKDNKAETKKETLSNNTNGIKQNQSKVETNNTNSSGNVSKQVTNNSKTIQSKSNKSTAGNNTHKQSCRTVTHPAVTHQEPVYSTQQVQTGTKTVVDKPAWQETVVDQPAYDNYECDGLMCNFCGQVFSSPEALVQHCNDVHDAAESYSTHYKLVHHDAVTHVVTHPAVTHQEPVYENRQVQTGTRTVTDKAAWNERVCN